MLTVMLSTLLVLQTLFAERSSTKRKALSQAHTSQCQASSVPNSLVALVSMILYGPNIKTQSSYMSTPQAALTLSQLLKFNSFARCRGRDTSHTLRHREERETPLPQYLGVLIHHKTRKRELVDALFELGLCISYDHVLSISTILGNNLCRQFEIEKNVCPPTLRKKLFTNATIDNLDHNTSSTTAEDSFHGTGIPGAKQVQLSAPPHVTTLDTQYFHSPLRQIATIVY